MDHTLGQITCNVTFQNVCFFFNNASWQVIYQVTLN